MDESIVNYRVPIDKKLYAKLKEYLVINNIKIVDFLKDSIKNEIDRRDISKIEPTINEDGLKEIDVDQLKEKVINNYGSLCNFSKCINISEPVLSRGFSHKRKFSEFTLLKIVKSLA